jgi:hypothetical protein
MKNDGRIRINIDLADNETLDVHIWRKVAIHDDGATWEHITNFTAPAPRDDRTDDRTP